MDCAQTSKEAALKQCSVVLDSAEVVNFYCGITGGYRYHYVSSTPKPLQKSVTPSAPCTLELVQDPEIFLQSLLLQEPQIGCVFEKTKLIEHSSPPAFSKKIVKTTKKCAPFSKRSKRVQEKHFKTGVNEGPVTEQNQCDVEQKVASAPTLEKSGEKDTEQTTDPPVNSIPEQNSDAGTCATLPSREKASVEVQNPDETPVEEQNPDETPVKVQNTDEIPVEVQNTDGIPVELQNTDGIPVELQNTEETSVELQNTDTTSVEVKKADETPIEVQNTEASSVEIPSLEETPTLEVQSKEETLAVCVEVQSRETEKSTDTFAAVPTTGATSVPNKAPKKKVKKQKNAGVCPDCRKVFRKWSEFINHMSTEHDALKCSECGKECQDFTELTKHQSDSHETRQHQCYLCDKIFSHEFTLKIHFFNLHLLNLESGAPDSSDSATLTSSENSSQILALPIAVAPAPLPKIDVPVPVSEAASTSTDEISYTVLVEDEVPSTRPMDTTPSEIINLEEIEDTEDLQSQVKQSLPVINSKSPNKKGARKSRFRNLHTPDGPEELVPQVEVKKAKTQESEVHLQSAVARVRSKEPKLVKCASDGRYVAMGNLVYFKYKTKMFQSCCYMCGFNLKSFADCVPHLRMAHTLYVCRLCGDEFCAPDGLKHHEVKQHKLEHFTCLACNLKFSNSEEKFKHYVSTHEEKKRCKPCSFYIQGEHHWRVHQALYHTPDLEWADCSPPFLNLSPPRINDGIAKKRSLQKSGEEIQLSPAKRRIVWHSDISEANCLPNNVRSKLVQAKHSVSDKLGMISPLSNSGLVDKLSKNNTQIIYKSKCDSRKSVPHSAVVISRVSLPNNSLLLSRVKGIQSAPQILDPSSNFQLLVPSQPPQVLTQVSAAKSPQVQSKKHIPVLKIVKRNTGTPQPPNSTPKYQIVSSPQGSKLIVGKPECLAGLKDISVSQKQVKLQQSTDIMVTPGKLPSLTSGLQSTKQHCDGIEVPGECRTKGKNNSVNKKKQGSVSRQNLNPKVVIAPLIVHPTTVKQTPRRPSILKNSLSKKQSKTVKNTVKLNSPRKSDVASSKAQETVSSSSTDKTQAPEQMEDTPVQSTAVSQTAVDKTINIDPQLSNSVESLIANWEVSLSNPKLSFTSTTSDVVDDCNNKIDEKSPDSSQQMDTLKSKQLGQVSDDVERYENSVAMEPNTMDICETSAEIKLKSGDEASALNPTGESTTMINAMEVATDVTVEVASCSSATPTHMDQIDSTIKILLPQPMDSNGTNVSYSPMEETHSDPMSHCNGDATSPDIDITIQVSSTAEKCESEVTDFESEAVSLPKSMKMDSNLQNDVGSIDDELCHVMDFSEPTEQLLSKPKPDMPVRQTEYLEQFLKFQNQNPR